MGQRLIWVRFWSWSPFAKVPLWGFHFFEPPFLAFPFWLSRLAGPEAWRFSDRRLQWEGAPSGEKWNTPKINLPHNLLKGYEAWVHSQIQLSQKQVLGASHSFKGTPLNRWALQNGGLARPIRKPLRTPHAGVTQGKDSG